jgi:hypothetical protein
MVNHTPKHQPDGNQGPKGKPYSREPNWATIAMVGAGVTAGIVLGAGIALLLAPRSGAHTRLALSRELRRRRPWRQSPWEELGDELKQVARRGRRRLRAFDSSDD